MLSTILRAVAQIYDVSIWNDRFCIEAYFKALIDGKLASHTCPHYGIWY